MRLDVSSSEVMPGYGEVSYDLNGAAHKLIRLRDAATSRGDTAGAEAWSAVLLAVEVAAREVGEAQRKQTWAAKRTAPCEACKR